MSHPFRAVPLFAGLALASLLASAQEAPPSFGTSIDVRVVNVEAVVTDRDGHRVSGLKPEDFRLRIDGKEVPIEYFSEVRDGEAQGAPAAPAEPAGPAGPDRSAAPVQEVAEGRVGTWYLVFIDDHFSIGFQRDAVLRGLKADLGRLGPEDRMAIVAYDGRRLAMLSNWSGSQADLARAFDQAMARKARGLNLQLAQSRERGNAALVAQMAASDGDTDPVPSAAQDSGLTASQSFYAGDVIRGLRGDVQATVSAMRAFAAPRGRKVMLLLSGGWPFSVQNYVGGGTGMPTQDLPGGDRIYRSLANTANLLGYTLYPIDVPGVQFGAADIRPESTNIAQVHTGLQQRKVMSPSAATPPPGPIPVPVDVGSDNVPEQEVEGTLMYLAQETGGRALLNSNRTLALALARDDTRSFYWLGFSPAWQHDDKRHEVRLEARRSGLKVRTRTGFLDLSRKAEVSMMVESALLFGNPPEGLRMPLKVGRVARPKKGELQVPLTLGLPVDLMTVVPDGKRYTVQLELRFAASDDAGNTTEVPAVPITLTSDHQPTPGKLVRSETKVTLLGAADHLVVAVYDPLSGKIATAETDVKGP
jgi:VWFA-related protein